LHTSAATIELCQLLLPDNGHIPEEDVAAFANRHHSSKHGPALPLYTAQEARGSRAPRPPAAPPGARRASPI